MNIWQDFKKPFFVLAPMDDVTDTVFRQIIADCAAPDLFVTEFVSVDGLQSKGRETLIKKLQFTPKEKPIIAQVWGLNPENYKKTAKELVKMGFDGIDINMGCPDRTVVKNGCCSALINNRELARDIIAATKEGADNKIPISVKTRIGFNEVDLSWPQMLLEQNLDALIIHGRTTKEMSKVANRWDIIEEIRRMRDKTSPETIFVGNGDVKSYQQGLKLAEKHGLDGIMIGRGVFNDPYVFSRSTPWSDMTSSERIGLYKKHIELFRKTWGETKNPAILKKFAKVYISNYDGASLKRTKLMRTNDTQAMLEELDKES